MACSRKSSASNACLAKRRRFFGLEMQSSSAKLKITPESMEVGRVSWKGGRVGGWALTSLHGKLCKTRLRAELSGNVQVGVV